MGLVCCSLTNPLCAIADEVHHLGVDPEEPEASGWGHAFTRLRGSAQLRLWRSGTLFWADQLVFCAARSSRNRRKAIPCHPSDLDTAADPLLCAHARTWFPGRPYLIRPSHNGHHQTPTETNNSCHTQCLRALGDKAGDAMRMNRP